MSDDAPTPPPTRAFWIGLVVGAPVIAYGAWGIFDTFQGPGRASYLRYFVGGAVIHDLLLAPAVCLLGWFVFRRLPAIALGPVQAAAIASGLAGLVAWPFVRGYGVTPGEPSFLSRDYFASLVVVWTVVWVLAAVAVIGRVLSARRR